jgi:uracil phosphoribosyltransferase
MPPAPCAGRAAQPRPAAPLAARPRAPRALRAARGRALRPTAMAPPRQMLVYVPPHPLIKHWVAVMRAAETPPAIFRSAAAELGRILIYEAARDWLPTVDAEVGTPGGAPAAVTFVDPSQPIKVVPILRAGLVLLEAAATTLPAAQTYHVGYVRERAADGEGWAARCYLNKLPERCAGCLANGGLLLFEVSIYPRPSYPRLFVFHLLHRVSEPRLKLFLRSASASHSKPRAHPPTRPNSLSPDDRVLVVDVMLATGVTAVAALADLVARGAAPANVRVVCALAAPPGLAALSDRYPDLKVYAGMLDAEVDASGHIVPGLGDAGDRAFGTL